MIYQIIIAFRPRDVLLYDVKKRLRHGSLPLVGCSVIRKTCLDILLYGRCHITSPGNIVALLRQGSSFREPGNFVTIPTISAGEHELNADAPFKHAPIRLEVLQALPVLSGRLEV